MIEEILFTTVANLLRKTEEVDDIGDMEENWQTVASGIPFDIQIRKVNKNEDWAGKQFKGNDVGYCNIILVSGTAIKPQSNDRVYDTVTGYTYDVEGVEERKNVEELDYYKFNLCRENV
jgi:hypothetical protein